MKTCLITVLVTSLLTIDNQAQTLPPAAPTGPATDTYFGVKVEDPYRNLENLQDPAVTTWMKAQSDYARRILDAIPGRAGLIDKMKEFDARKAAKVVQFRVSDSGRYFYLKSRPQDQQPKLYCREGYNGAETLLFDPEKHEAGKVYTVNEFSPSFDGSKVAFGISLKGGEVGTIMVMDVKTRKLLPDKITPAWGSGAWLPDNNSFTYTPLNSADLTLPTARLNTQSRLHRVGTPQSQDRALLSSTTNPELNIKPEVYPFVFYDRDSKLTFGMLSTVERYLTCHYAPTTALAQSKITWRPLFWAEQEVTNFNTDGQYIYYSTSKNTPHEKIMRMPVAKPDVAAAEVLVPESADEALNAGEMKTTKDGLFFVRTRNGVQAKLYFVPKGSKTVEEVKLPVAAGSITLQNRNADSPDLWVLPVGWVNDRKRYRYTVATRQFTSEPLSSEAQYPEYANLTVEEVMVPSHDGVQVPLSLIYKKGLARTGNTPVLMFGYGAYSISMDPAFSPNYLLWTQQGGIFAVPHVRGGGELGEAWHKAGQKTTKPNTWKDLIASAEHLIKNQYTSPSRIAIVGGSAGGILIGRAMTERPDLFAAAIPEVGCLNALRMENSPNGPVNVPEFGTVQKEDEFRALLEMDAYHHLKPGTKYPATLVTAGMNDPRVIAWQPAKFAARLQATNASGKPVLFFTDYEAGHGIGDAKQKQFESVADILSFGLWHTGHPDFQVSTVANK